MRTWLPLSLALLSSLACSGILDKVKPTEPSEPPRLDDAVPPVSTSVLLDLGGITVEVPAAPPWGPPTPASPAVCCALLGPRTVLDLPQQGGEPLRIEAARWPEVFPSDPAGEPFSLTSAQKHAVLEPFLGVWATRTLKAPVTGPDTHYPWSGLEVDEEYAGWAYLESGDGALRGLRAFVNESQEPMFNPSLVAALVNPAGRVWVTLTIKLTPTTVPGLAPFFTDGVPEAEVPARVTAGLAFLGGNADQGALGALVARFDQAVEGLKLVGLPVEVAAPPVAAPPVAPPESPREGKAGKAGKAGKMGKRPPDPEQRRAKGQKVRRPREQ